MASHLLDPYIRSKNLFTIFLLPGYEVVTYNILDQKIRESGHFGLTFIPTGCSES